VVSALDAAITEWLTRLRVRNYAPSSVANYAHRLSVFSSYCKERGVDDPAEVTPALVTAYQHHLFVLRGRTGELLSPSTQAERLIVLNQLFAWLAKTGVIASNTAADIEFPRRERRLPPAPLSIDEVEAVLAVPDVATPFGLRDRAILEVFYSSAIRRAELLALKLGDVDHARGTLFVRHGKGGKDRYVPIGDRALFWIARYVEEIRPSLVGEPDHEMLFVAYTGRPLSRDFLSEAVKDYIDAAGISKHGSCHLLRHTAATLMLEGGADIRFVAEMLGHTRLETTQIYTRVSIYQLRRVHAATHPGARHSHAV
jgi:integrase/recombinase XerD